MCVCICLVYVFLCLCVCVRAPWLGLPALLWSLLSSVGAELFPRYLFREAEAWKAEPDVLSHKEPA